MENPCLNCRHSAEGICTKLRCFPRKDYEKYLANRQPCYKCPDRKAGCHGVCQKYIDWRIAWTQIRKTSRENPEQVTQYFVERSQKIDRQERRKKGEKR